MQKLCGVWEIFYFSSFSRAYAYSLVCTPWETFIWTISPSHAGEFHRGAWGKVKSINKWMDRWHVSSAAPLFQRLWFLRLNNEKELISKWQREQGSFKCSIWFQFYFYLNGNFCGSQRQGFLITDSTAMDKYNPSFPDSFVSEMRSAQH